MPLPSLPPRRHLVAGVAALGLLGGGAAVANAATTAPTPATPSGSSAPATPPTPPAPRPHLDGTVTAVSGSTITIKDHDGFTRVIQAGSSTTFTLDGKASSLAAVTKGRFVHADGSVDANGTSLDAATVAIMTSAPKPGAVPDGRGPAPAGRPGGPGGPGRPGGAGGPAAPGAGRPSGTPPKGGTPPAPPAGAPSAPSSAPSSSASSSAHGS